MDLLLWLSQNWDTFALILSNVVALFMNPPFKRFQ